MITDVVYMAALFDERIKEIDVDGEKIAKLWLSIYKKYVNEKFFHCVVRYNFVIKLTNGLRRRYELFGVSFSKHGRKKMFSVMQLVNRNGFSEGRVVIPKLLWYDQKLMTVFYIGVPGDSFLEHVKNGHLEMTTLRNIAQAVRKIHGIKIDRGLNIEQHDFSRQYFDATGILQEKRNLHSALYQKVEKQFSILKKMHGKFLAKEKIFLSHGDFHPENVIINKFNSRQAVIIDFSESCLASRYYDIASFVEQFDFMTRRYLAREQREKLEEVFLRAYFGKETIEPEERQKINLYRAWTAFKNAVYFMVSKDIQNCRHADELLDKVKRYIAQAV